MTGIADFYLYLKRPYSRDRRKRLYAHFVDKTEPHTRFVVLSWKRTGSNLLCGILHNHPEIVMHNELFNPIDIFTYHPAVFRATSGPNNKPRWSVLTRDLFPLDFLDYVWSGRTPSENSIKPNFRAIGFKSFPDHWVDVRNEAVWQSFLLQDFRIKKIVLIREDELAVYVSMKRADATGRYMTHGYPKDLKIRVDPAEFQVFVHNYRNTFRRKYTSPMEDRDTFRITYDQLTNEEDFEATILPKLWDFLGVDNKVALKKLKETVKQADPNEDLSSVIENYAELEFCFRHSDILHFVQRREQNYGTTAEQLSTPLQVDTLNCLASWSLLLPICSRPTSAHATRAPHSMNGAEKFNSNRFIDLALTSQHIPSNDISPDACWEMLENFAESLKNTASNEQLELTECVVGIDIDDCVFQNEVAHKRIQEMLPCAVQFVKIRPEQYGQVCKIWNALAAKAKNDFIVLLGDDVKLLDKGWQERIVRKFHEISREQHLPFGAACVVMKDLSFPGFPTFPVLHRWHVKHFGSLLPKQFANQGGDPYLYELYSRFNAAAFEVSCRLENTIGGDGDARYQKYHINWRGQILDLNLRLMKGFLNETKPKGLCLDIVVPSYRTNNNEYLERIGLLRATVNIYVRFWFVVDNPDCGHVEDVKRLANELNEAQLKIDGNYFINVIHYGENRGASYARNMGYNYTTADWVLFLDDDIIPDENLLDAYAAAIQRYPHAKVFVGMTELPEACNAWTEMLCACNVGYFYGIAKREVHPSWGVTANLMVRGSRYNSTIQFKSMFPKTGGGEDIDFVYQYKEWYRSLGRLVTVGVPEAKVRHPWWNQSKPCYRQIAGWAWGDSLCLTEWSQKTFLTLPNWIEHVMFLIAPLTMYSGNLYSGLAAGWGTILLEHIFKTVHYFSDAKRVTRGALWRSTWVALGAGSVLSAQEVTRAVALVRRGSLYSLCRRVDWFDGEKPRIKLDIQLASIFRFALNAGLTWAAFQCWRPKK